MMDGLNFAQDLLEKEPWLPTPLLPALVTGQRLGMELWLKREDCTPVGSFKLRGALVAAARRTDSGSGIYASTAGNYGLAIALACQINKIKATIVMPNWANPSKVERMKLTGATVIMHSDDVDTAKDHCIELAERDGAVFWEDGTIEEMALGTTTIAAELLTHSGPWDYVLVPLGNGSLIKGIATVFKKRSPKTKVIGVQAGGAPAMYHWIKGNAWDSDKPVDTVADSISVRVPIPEISNELKSLIDDVWLVEESKILSAVRTLLDVEQVMAEPASSTPVAAAAMHRTELQGKKVAAIITSGHLRLSLMPSILSVQGIV